MIIRLLFANVLSKGGPERKNPGRMFISRPKFPVSSLFTLYS